MDADPVPLVVDLDGTLCRGDSSRQGLMRLCVRRPWQVPRVVRWWRHGRARAKAGIMRSIGVGAAQRLRFRAEVLAYLQQEQRAGRTLYLATGADRRTAQAVATQLKLFTAIFASDGRTNLIGAAKRDVLIARFGRGGFDYVGDSRADVAVWAAARRALVVGRRDPGVPCWRRFA